MAKISIQDSVSANKIRALEDILKENNIFLDTLKQQREQIQAMLINQSDLVSNTIEEYPIVNLDKVTVDATTLEPNNANDSNNRDTLFVDKRRKVNNG